MNWLWVLSMIIIALALASIGLVASADPEGRGAHLASVLFGSALAALVFAVSLSMYLGAQ